MQEVADLEPLCPTLLQLYFQAVRVQGKEAKHFSVAQMRLRDLGEFDDCCAASEIEAVGLEQQSLIGAVEAPTNGSEAAPPVGSAFFLEVLVGAKRGFHGLDVAQKGIW